MTLSNHAWRRVVERLTPKEQQAFFEKMKKVEEFAATAGHDWALRLMSLGGQRNEAWSDESNGDSVWAIVRRGEVKTVMLRRSVQPATADAMRVDKVGFL